MSRDSGTAEFSAVMLLFFIATVVSGAALFSATGMAYARADARDHERKSEADELLAAIVADMQMLSRYPCDDPRNDFIEALRRKYAPYGLELADVSSGYHLDFLSDADMADNSLAKFLFRDGSGIAFARWRDANGLSASKTGWKEFVNEAAWESCVSYGWLHTGDEQSFASKKISASFAVSSPEKLFPLVNDFPRINVNMVKPEALRPLFMRGAFKIEKPVEKADAFAAALGSGPVSPADISAVLKIPANHPLMGYLGTKTAFWKISFAFRGLSVEGIAAAIPRKNGKAQEIEAYRLIDRSFIND